MSKRILSLGHYRQSASRTKTKLNFPYIPPKKYVRVQANTRTAGYDDKGNFHHARNCWTVMADMPSSHLRCKQPSVITIMMRSVPAVLGKNLVDKAVGDIAA